MVLNDTILIDNFVKYFNARLCPIDFISKLDRLGRNYNPLQEQILRLPVDSTLLFSQLEKANYSKLIERIIKNIQIDDTCNDIFCSEINNAIVDFFRDYISDNRLNFKVLNDGNDYFIVTNDIMADLIIHPISQLHSEIIDTFRYFHQMLDTVGVNQRFFLNSNSSTAFSYFIQIFVAESLSIPLNVLDNYSIVY